jgi:monoamine oxidase
MAKILKISRRRFLGAAATLPVHMALERSWALSVSDPQAVSDVAIIGGGIAGVYVAWKLLKDPHRRFPAVKVFEASDHIGGRLLSVQPPNDCGFVAELGGMRIGVKVHCRVHKLIETLKISSDLYDMPVTAPENISFLRGVRLRFSDFKSRPDLVPYHLEPHEQGLAPGVILRNAIESLFPGIVKQSMSEQRERLQEEKINGVEIYRQGFWNVLAPQLSGEAYQFCVDASGYESVFDNWNAADAIPWFLADSQINGYMGFKKGFQQVPLLLAGEVTSGGGQIECNRTLRTFDYKDGLFGLRFDTGDPVHARRLVLAMPRRSLELLAQQSPSLRHESVSELIRSVTARPMLKFFATYELPWWNAVGVPGHPLQRGRTTTDLPLRQIYYWTKGGEAVTRGDSMLMASYSDGRSVRYWEGLRCHRINESTSSSIDKDNNQCTPFEGRKAPSCDVEWYKYAPETRMVREVQRQLAQVHGLRLVPEAVNAGYKNWGDDPFGGGWNSWNVGVRSWDVRDKIVQPLKSIPLYICGEAYSDWQGWVEGALQTAEIALERMGI